MQSVTHHKHIELIRAIGGAFGLFRAHLVSLEQSTEAVYKPLSAHLWAQKGLRQEIDPQIKYDWTDCYML